MQSTLNVTRSSKKSEPLFIDSRKQTTRHEDSQEPEEIQDFVGWKLYFGFKDIQENSDLTQKVSAVENHLRRFQHLYNLEEIAEKHIMDLNYEHVQCDDEFQKEWTDFYEELIANPTETLDCIGLAMHNIVIKSEMSHDDAIFRHSKIYVRPLVALPNTKIKEVLDNSNRLVQVSGTVSQVGGIESVSKLAAFLCRRCNRELVVLQKSDASTNLTYPTSCTDGCFAKSDFVPQLTSPNSTFHVHQMVQLRDMSFDIENPFPTVNLCLGRQNVSTLFLGETVKATGVVEDKEYSKTKPNKNVGKTFSTVLNSLNVEPLHKLSDMSHEKLESLEMIRDSSSPFRLIVNSLCTTICGQEEVKAGLVLSLVSGSNLMPQSRSESHILMLGNPGTGKSKLLQACSEVSPKCVMVNGPTSTAAGLTACVSRNGTLNAGSLLLASGGVCCIDEFDKMHSHYHALLESMEQQTISISKSGARVNLHTNTSIIAAANPTNSAYDKTKTLFKNTKILNPLLNRFDIIYVMISENEQNSKKFVERVIASRETDVKTNSPTTTFSFDNVNRKNLKWLRLNTGENFTPLVKELLRDYIDQVRQNVNPVLSNDAADEIGKFFRMLKALDKSYNHNMITMRQLDALSRLTLARARIDCETVATREHAVDVINLFKFSMNDFFSPDREKEVSFSNISIASLSEEMKIYHEYVLNEAKRQNKKFFTRKELKMMSIDLGLMKFDEIMMRLNLNGSLLSTRNGYTLKL